MKSIKKRLLLGLLTVILLGTLGGAALTYFELKEEMDELFDENMKQVAHAIAVHNITEHSNFVSGNTDIRRTLKGEEEFLIQVWQGDQINFSSKPVIKFPYQGPGGVVTVMYEDEEWRYYGLDAGDGWLVQVSQPIPMRHTVIWEIYFEQLIPTFLQFIIIMGLVWFVVDFGFSPLKRISQYIEKRSANFLERLPEEDIPKEVFTIVQAINGLLERLSMALDTQRQFTADAAHELRTPLTAVRLELDVLKRAESEEDRQQSLEKLYKAVDRSTRLAHQLLEIAQSESEQVVEKITSVSLWNIAQTIALEMQQFSQAKNINLRIEGSDKIVVQGRPHALAAMMGNLVSNALHYTLDGGTVVVTLLQQGGSAILRVSDNGPGIPQTERARVFDRFYRVLNKNQSEIPGSGLGLSIVRAIVDSHDARIVILDGLEGKGACFEVSFPSAI